MRVKTHVAATRNGSNKRKICVLEVNSVNSYQFSVLDGVHVTIYFFYSDGLHRKTITVKLHFVTIDNLLFVFGGVFVVDDDCLVRQANKKVNYALLHHVVGKPFVGGNLIVRSIGHKGNFLVDLSAVGKTRKFLVV